MTAQSSHSSCRVFCPTIKCEIDMARILKKLYPYPQIPITPTIFSFDQQTQMCSIAKQTRVTNVPAHLQTIGTQMRETCTEKPHRDNSQSVNDPTPHSQELTHDRQQSRTKHTCNEEVYRDNSQNVNDPMLNSQVLTRTRQQPDNRDICIEEAHRDNSQNVNEPMPNSQELDEILDESIDEEALEDPQTAGFHREDWSEEDTKVLLEELTSLPDDQLGGCYRAPVWRRLGRILQRPAAKVRYKWFNMKKAYKKAQLENTKSGNKRKSCAFYEQLHEILHKDTSINPPTLRESCSLSSNTSYGRGKPLPGSRQDSAPIRGQPSRVVSVSACTSRQVTPSLNSSPLFSSTYSSVRSPYTSTSNQDISASQTSTATQSIPSPSTQATVSTTPSQGTTTNQGRNNSQLVSILAPAVPSGYGNVGNCMGPAVVAGHERQNEDVLVSPGGHVTTPIQSIGTVPAAAVAQNSVNNNRQAVGFLPGPQHGGSGVNRAPAAALGRNPENDIALQHSPRNATQGFGSERGCGVAPVGRAGGRNPAVAVQHNLNNVNQEGPVAHRGRGVAPARRGGGRNPAVSVQRNLGNINQERPVANHGRGVAPAGRGGGRNPAMAVQRNIDNVNQEGPVPHRGRGVAPAGRGGGRNPGVAVQDNLNVNLEGPVAHRGRIARAGRGAGRNQGNENLQPPENNQNDEEEQQPPRRRRRRDPIRRPINMALEELIQQEDRNMEMMEAFLTDQNGLLRRQVEAIEANNVLLREHNNILKNVQGIHGNRQTQ